MTAVLDEPLTPTFVDPKAHARTRQNQAMLEEIAWLRSFGWSWGRIGQRLGYPEGTITKAVARAAEQGLVIE